MANIDYKNVGQIWAKKVRIYPTDYKKNLKSKNFHVAFKYYDVNSTRKAFQKKSYDEYLGDINGEEKFLTVHINRIKNHTEKVEKIELLKDTLIDELKNNPLFVEKIYLGKEFHEKKIKSLKDVFREYFERKLHNRKNTSSMKSIVNSFIEFIPGNYKLQDIKKLDVSKYLQEAQKQSASSYNNKIRENRAIFNEMINDRVIDFNPFLGYKMKKTNPELNIAYTVYELKLLFGEMKSYNENLYYFVSHVFYSILRPVEIARIQYKHVNFEQKTFFSDTKTSKMNVQIPEKLWSEFYYKLKDLKEDVSPNVYLFTKEGVSLTDSLPKSRARMFNDWLTKYKVYLENKYDHKFHEKSTMYSFRHAAIGVLFQDFYNELLEKKESFAMDKALTKTREITRHANNDILKQYLRDINYLKIMDWSDKLDKF